MPSGPKAVTNSAALTGTDVRPDRLFDRIDGIGYQAEVTLGILLPESRRASRSLTKKPMTTLK